MYRIPVFRPPPVFVVSKDFVMKEAIGRICEQVDKRFFLLSVKPLLLKWRLDSRHNQLIRVQPADFGEIFCQVKRWDLAQALPAL
jgi:hypothetical protein